jgi:signal transduction histidine kinase
MAESVPKFTPRRKPVAATLRPVDGLTIEGGDAAALRDLTRLYLKALEAQRAKDGLLAVAAHELRHPLHLMRMALARHLDEHNPARDQLERYIQRMVRLIDDLVDFIRTEQDALELQRDWIDLQKLLVDLLEDYRSTFDERRVRLSLVMPGQLRVSADPQRLIQVFSNLLDNALKFTPAGGAVVIEVSRGEREIRIAVRDSGRGVAADILPRVLDMPSTLSSPHGLGIGLSVARRIVELHGGTIAVRSDGPGKGTEAVVTLPMLDGPA